MSPGIRSNVTLQESYWPHVRHISALIYAMMPSGSPWSTEVVARRIKRQSADRRPDLKGPQWRFSLSLVMKLYRIACHAVAEMPESVRTDTWRDVSGSAGLDSGSVLTNPPFGQFRRAGSLIATGYSLTHPPSVHSTIAASTHRASRHAARPHRLDIWYPSPRRRPQPQHQRVHHRRARSGLVASDRSCQLGWGCWCGISQAPERVPRHSAHRRRGLPSVYNLQSMPDTI